MKLKINLQNCYGIKALNTELDFGKKHAFSIYASNGTMKTSLAKTFFDLSNGKESKDEIYPHRETVREILQDDSKLLPEEVFVIEPYVHDYRSDKIAQLLVNQTIKKQYDKIYNNIRIAKEEFLQAMCQLSNHQSIKDVEEEISRVFYHGQTDKFFESLNRVKDEIATEEVLFNDVEYANIFYGKTEELFKDETFIKNVDQYVQKYNELLEQSNFFKKGIFNDKQAEDVATQLEKNGFFEAGHYAILIGKSGDLKKEVTNKENLIKVIEEEKANILQNQELKTLYEHIKKKLDKNNDLRGFREYLANRHQVMSQLSNPLNFKAKLWKEYFKRNEQQFNTLLEMRKHADEKIKEIRAVAQKERGKWHKVINDFNNRFHVPFTVEVGNRIETVLGEGDPNSVYRYNNEVEIEEIKLKAILSQGEKKALYILNILYEIEVRKESANNSLLIIDDLADSFDYQNKYAIIEYLRELSNHNNFYLIILTHNFDFHRTVCRRLGIKKYYRHAIKTNGTIKLIDDIDPDNPINSWRENLNNPIVLIATIPMVRNLFEYSGKKTEYKYMTSFLHMKEGTKTLTLKDLKSKVKNILSDSSDQNIANTEHDDKNYYELLSEQCDSLLQKTELVLEEKIVLSIGIRLKAEDFMIRKINNPEFISTISDNQTYRLRSKYKTMFKNDTDMNKKLERVNLMTPENIHLNSFMYEPLIDMGSKQLIDLYNDIHELLSESD